MNGIVVHPLDTPVSEGFKKVEKRGLEEVAYVQRIAFFLLFDRNFPSECTVENFLVYWISLSIQTQSNCLS